MAAVDLAVMLEGLSGILHIALAGYLVRIRTTRRATLAFAAFLAVSGLYLLLDTVNTTANNAGDARLATVSIVPGLVLFPASVVLAAHFALLYPRAWGPGRWSGASVVAYSLVGAMLLAGVLAPSLLGEPTVTSRGRIVANFQPWVTIMGLFVGNLVIATVLGVFHARESGPVRRSIALVAVGFAATAGLGVGALFAFLRGDVAIGVAPAAQQLALVGRGVGTAALVGTWAWRVAATQGQDRRGAWLVLASFGVGLVGAAAAHVSLAGWRLDPQAALAVSFVPRFLFPLAVSYALVRHQLFDIDLKIKWTLRRGTVAAAFVAVFFVVANVAQNFFSTALGWVYGGVAAGLLLFALAPLQRAAERLADRAMPGVEDTPDYRASRKLDSYKFMLRASLEDGVLTADEEQRLAHLQEDLGIPAAAALAARQDVARELGLAHITVQT